VLYKRGEASAAVPVLARIVTELPEAPLARYHLGMAQALAGNSADAKANLTKAVDSGQHFAGLEEAKTELDRLKQAAPDTTPKS
jgi:hypothetical protein